MGQTRRYGEIYVTLQFFEASRSQGNFSKKKKNK